MEQEPIAALDQQVKQTLEELEPAGPPASVETVARTLRRRTADVLSAMKRVAGVGPSEPDAATSPERYPAVVAAVQKMAAIAAAIYDAERTLTERENLLARAEAQAAEAVADGLEAPSLVPARQAVQAAAETLHLWQLAQVTAKDRYTEALAVAEARHWAAQWQGYQEAVRAYDEALAVAYAAQEEAMRWWNRIGQPGEPPLLKGPLSVFADHFHPFLREMILDLPPEQVQRGTSFAGVHPQPRAF